MINAYISFVKSANFLPFLSLNFCANGPCDASTNNVANLESTPGSSFPCLLGPIASYIEN